MSRTVTLRAPAKLNLFLHIIGRRPDGYHQLQTVFQLIDLCDELRFTVTDEATLSLRGGPTDISPESNLVMRAARLLAPHCTARNGVQIELRKRIPTGGGLGGGSSDAGATLLALNRLWSCGLALPELAQLGLQLGADVPVFVHGASAWAEGIGEQLQAIELPERWYLVIRPGCAVNTAAIFADRELTRNTPTMTIAGFLAGGGHNDCETVVRKRYPEVDRALGWLSRHGTARMSGTGSCLFAAFGSERQARAVAAGVPQEWDWFVARGINHSTVHEALY
ncbi:MAG: 4-(cytidine 5'-diphospho)-2-C-methyl-D-erythritol kinase [Gammaproteobacteria bacterium]|jgi:4-diphosphocytidyl-2-C-methyl-D-erythritol kinase|nr:4-(cytidine 5'-diphospho)-2-C-methyl-D-erythritol kinase [Gammaproteobacteria bacterium]MBP6051745.1 4-(cytidine 5'-diphospho)-2-C-methyl-D-erythritol kinase [Pseudomonadales bacterium]MBK7519737.1 4-(cytidine 5'-diphospho)-2-C-methyl-D-erythritol kinase [Gammaproteobacteria bacterium]MBK7731016.1 4-(cytidine 5'-diphospho)-2-C-methyl-D-erythritol kinase [Gammaproteobacteria bacterium]MBK9666616.1 4-(cytidine 5'-diphospho)-2-C-methyl-D-erythritol kinase [Gammaproteobacteria bacterium]